MRHALLIVTRSLEPLNDVVIATEQSLPDVQVQVVDLTGEKPDYAALLDAVFRADSVQVWS